MSSAMGDLLEYRSPREHGEKTSRLGMVIFLGSWAMLFCSLFFAYGMVRSRASVWPPADVPVLPIGLPALNTLAIVLSSVALHLALRATQRGRTSLTGPSLAASTVLGAGFLALQWVVWTDLHGRGLTASSGQYGSVFYALTGLHALHVLVGIGALSGLTINAFRGRYTPARVLPIRLWSMYWHFVCVVWVLMYLTVYLV